MRLKLRDVKKALYVCGILAFLVAIHVASVYLFAVHRFSITYDPILSEHAQRRIEAFVREAKLYDMQPDALAAQLKDEFPCICNVRCRYMPDHCVRIAIQAYAPTFRLHEAMRACQRVVTENNHLIPAEYYEPYICSKQPKLSISVQADELQLPNDVFAYLQSLDRSTLVDGSVDWRHRNEILIQVAQLPVRILCNQEHEINSEVLEHCHRIYQDLAQKPGFKNGIHADVRFDDRIIVSKVKS